MTDLFMIDAYRNSGAFINKLDAGDKVTSPGGRLLRVADVFVPRNNSVKGAGLPSSYRNFPRKVVVFDNGAIAPLTEIRSHYRIAG